MEERLMDHLSPADEDPVVHGYLTALGRPSPASGLANRVLVNVWQPKAAWLRRVEAKYDELVESGRIWFVIGAFAAGSLIPIAVAIVAAVAWGNQLAWGVGEVGPRLWGSVVTGWSSALSEISRIWTTYMPGSGVLKTAALVTLITTVICSIGLYRMVQLDGKMRS